MLDVIIHLIVIDGTCKIAHMYIMWSYKPLWKETWLCLYSVTLNPDNDSWSRLKQRVLPIWTFQWNLCCEQIQQFFLFLYIKRMKLSNEHGWQIQGVSVHGGMTGFNQACPSPPLVLLQVNTSSSARRGEGWPDEIFYCLTFFFSWLWSREQGVLVFLAALVDMAAPTGQVGPGHLEQ